MRTPRLRASAAVGLAWVCLLSIALSTGSEAEEAAVAVRGSIIPTGFSEGKYAVLVQVAVDGSPLPDAAWELEASLISPGRPRREFSARVDVAEPWTPAVLEFQTSLEPGPFTIEMSARETTAGQAGVAEIKDNWPDPTARLATVTPVAIVQPAEAVISRGGTARNRGAISRGDGEPLRNDLPTAMVSVVCRRPGQEGATLITRRLAGGALRDFGTIEMAPDELCAQIRDLIQPGSLSVGAFRYEVQVIVEGVRIASGVREFDSAAPASPGQRTGVRSE